MPERKVYLATITLGIETDTFDPTGRVVSTRNVPELSPEYIREKALGFVGEIEQVPPAYSAVKYMGTRAYKLARRGQEVELKKRTVTVHSLRIVSVELPYVTMEIRCSSGTYIRSIAADLGKELGSGGHLKSLRRLASGSFRAQNAIKTGEILKNRSHSFLRQKVIPLRAALPNMGEIEVEDQLVRKVRNGYQPAWEELTTGKDFALCKVGHAKLVGGGELVAIVKVRNCEGVDYGDKVKIERVFF
jgi:tRNA pseudouridine55 synthase